LLYVKIFSRLGSTKLDTKVHTKTGRQGFPATPPDTLLEIPVKPHQVLSSPPQGCGLRPERSPLRRMASSVARKGANHAGLRPDHRTQGLALPRRTRALQLGSGHGHPAMATIAETAKGGGENRSMKRGTGPAFPNLPTSEREVPHGAERRSVV